MQPIPEEYVRKAIEFGTTVSTKYYGARNGQYDAEKRVRDQIIGKLAEFVVYGELKGTDSDMTPPDCEVYPAGKKSWKEDLTHKEMGAISVKGQDVKMAAIYGQSWVFEKIDRGNPDHIAFVSIDLENRQYEIIGIKKASEIVYGELKKKSLNATKKAVYAKDNF